ncbi:site-specific integrase [Acidovorax sp. ST3]|uniref:site-specific integrase n=1 Tax=Acidovorax sp. ST3 TaxID=2219062 RepID=UPI00129087DD|nr:site-specific integrase [Acidovorax sp. ST3]
MSNLPHTLSQWSSDEYFSAEVARLPLPPRVIVYEDDYSEKMCSVNTDEAHSRVELADAGGHVMLNFAAFGERVRPLIRLFLLTSLVDYAPATVATYYKGLRVIPESSLVVAAVSEPVALRAKWPALTTDLPYESINVFKRFISFFCLVGFGSWAHRYQALVSTLPSPHKDVYAAVRSGDCFLEIEEEVALVRWIDQAAASVTTLVGSDIRIAALVVCSYQFGMRPKQLGTLRKRDCEIRVSKESGLPSVYLTFRTLKQQDVQASRLPLLRKVKREWAPLLVATYGLLSDAPSSAYFFGFQNRMALSASLISKLDVILPGRGRVAYDLRHSMVQRMVDAGASQEEVAAALGHTRLTTGLVYFRASANQAELVNKALGLSETFQTLAKIADHRFISDEELAHLKGEQQIAGVPHGIPIAGIGGCKTGQPSCPYNPVTACYGCTKFMPVRDLALHEQVLKDFRSVVNKFRTAGEGDEKSPAYLQLRQAIEEVKGVIHQLEGNDGK